MWIWNRGGARMTYSLSPVLRGEGWERGERHARTVSVFSWSRAPCPSPEPSPLSTGERERIPIRVYPRSSAVSNEFLRDLDRVRRRALADLVAGDEQLDPAAVFAADVL